MGARSKGISSQKICLTIIILISVAVFDIGGYVYAYTVPAYTAVYVTNTGEKYHRDGCPHLHSSRSMTISQAESAGYTACSLCHPDRLTGTYHSSSNSHSSSGASASLPSSSEPHVTTPAEDSQRLPASPLLKPAIYSAIGIIIVATVVIRRKWNKAQNAKREAQLELERKRYLEEQRQAEIERQKQKEEAAQLLREHFFEKKAQYTELYGGKNPEDLAGMPVGTTIGPDGMPKELGPGKWGPLYTRYVAPTGKVAHAIEGCSGARIPAHVYDVIGLPLCGRCGKQAPSLKWFYEYQRIGQIKRKYGIDCSTSGLTKSGHPSEKKLVSSADGSAAG